MTKRSRAKKNRARIRCPFYVAGGRVKVLLALFPSALHLDPPSGDGLAV